MTAFRFHLIGGHQLVELEVAVGGIADLGEVMARQHFMEGRLVQSDSDAMMLVMLIATPHIQLALETA